MNDQKVEENYGVATVGQGKWMAQSAFSALEGALGKNSPVVKAIKADLFKKYDGAPAGVFYPGRPAEPSAEWLGLQKAPLQIGALKALAAPFYRHLSALDAAWIETQLHENNLVTEGLHYFEDSDGTFYPWNPADNGNASKNRLAVAIGQLKAVFSLRFESLDTIGDRDGDGLTNSEEIALGSDPENPDTDGDGIPDGWEVEWGLNPSDGSDADKDFDGDLVSNLREYETGRIPTGLYRVETVALNAVTNEHLAGAGPDGALLLARDGNTLNLAGATVGSGVTGDWIAPSNPPSARSRVAMPFGSWQTAGATPETHSTRYQLAGGSKVRLQYRYQKTSGSGGSVIDDDYLFAELNPVASTHTSKNWDTICGALHAAGYLPSATVPIPNGLVNSPDGSRILFSTGTKHLVLDQAGAFVDELPNADTAAGITSIEWKAINDLGSAAGIGAPGAKPVFWQAATEQTSTGFFHVREIPEEWGTDTWAYRSDLTSKSLIVVERGTGEFHLLDATTGAFTGITLPAISTTLPEAVVYLEDSGRLLGSGDIPWMSVQGVTAKLENMRIEGASPGDPDRKLSTLGWTNFSASYLATNGVITGEASLPAGGRAVVQLIPVTDQDGDGVPDDYEIAYADWIEDTFQVDVPNDAGSIDVNVKDPSAEISVGAQWNLGNAAPKILGPGSISVRRTLGDAWHTGLSTVEEVWGPGSYPRATYYSKATYTLDNSYNYEIYNVVGEDIGDGERDEVHSEVLTWSEPSGGWKNVKSSFAPNKPSHAWAMEWKPSWVVSGHRYIDEYFDLPENASNTRTVSSHSSRSYDETVDEEDHPTMETTVTYVLNGAPNPPPATYVDDMRLYRAGRTIPTDEEIDWLDPEEFILDYYVDPGENSYTTSDSEGEKNWELSQPKDWRNLAQDAFRQAATNAISYDGYVPAGGDPIVVTGGIGAGTTSFGEAAPEAHFEEAKLAIRAGNADKIIAIKRQRGKMVPASATWVDQSGLFTPPPWQIDEDMELIWVPAGETKVLSRSSVPGAGYDWVTHIIQVCSVEVVGQDWHTPVGENLSIANMHAPNVIAGVGTASPTLNIDNDPERFYIKISGGAFFASSATLEVGAIDKSSKVTDNKTTINLHVEGSSLISDSMMMVADDKDDNHDFTDNLPNDRTHKIELGGWLRLESLKVAGQDFAIDTRREVKRKGTVTIEPVILRKSAGGANTVNPDVVEKQLKEAKAVYAQIGIEVLWGGIAIEDPPSDIGLEDGLEISEWDDPFDGHDPTEEEMDLINAFGGPVAGKIRAYYVDFEENAVGHAAPDQDTVFIDSDSQHQFYVLAHEMAHVIFNLAHSKQWTSEGLIEYHSNPINILFPDPAGHNRLDSTKRIDSEQEAKARDSDVVIWR